MPPIVPLPVFEADADSRHRDAMSDEEIYAALEPPSTMVVRFGYMGLIGEFPYEGDARPGCGSRLVARTHRGTELATMLTTTCENAGCAKSVTRQEMREYIEASGGEDFPFHEDGRILRVATIEDLNKQSALEAEKSRFIRTCKHYIYELKLGMKLVDVESILGGELLTFYYMAESRVDFRELVKKLAGEFKTRIEMRQVGARDEARLVADYERCGQHCCCKSFLKVLKPVSMRSAKVQKATLDPLKISGRCGRLMCCLRYEDKTYTELKANLPRRNSRVGTAQGPGVVIDTKILVQLALVRLDYDSQEIAVPVEELMSPDACPPPGTKPAGETDEALRGLTPEEAAEKTDDPKRSRRRRRRKSRKQQQDTYREKAQKQEGESPAGRSADRDRPEGDQARRRKRRRRRGRSKSGSGGSGSGPGSGGSGSGPGPGSGSGTRGDEGGRASQPPDGSSGGDRSSTSGGQRKRRRRRRGRGGPPRDAGPGDNNPKDG